MNEPMTFTICREGWHEIPWGEQRIITQVYEGNKRVSSREVCLDCFEKTRGRTGSAPGDTEATEQATVHAEGDSGSGGARRPHERLVAPERPLSMSGGPHVPAGGGAARP